MADYELSLKADEDLTEIYVFSHRRFGERAADAYLSALDERFSLLAERPQLGRSTTSERDTCDTNTAVTRSSTSGEKGGIIIMRVLHQSMDSERHIG